MHMSNGYASPLNLRPIVVKYGGNALPQPGARDEVLDEISQLWSAGSRIVLVHGGGPEIDRALEDRGLTTRRVDGLRVTDAATLQVTEAVLCGTLNKRLVRACARLGVSAAGVSGEDGGLLVADREASPHGEDLGYVGRIVCCDPALLKALLSTGWMPVVAPLARSMDASHAYNVNADLAAAAIAGALQARAFVAITNVPRVYADPENPASAIDRISLEAARAFLASAGCRDSMKPKVQAAIAAVENGADASFICAAGTSAIRAALERGEATIVTSCL
jgi:acetylglutamate kinase